MWSLDGVSKTYMETFSQNWPPYTYSSQNVYAHEMGHAMGVPHSSGPYGQIYDSRWDVMSGGATYFNLQFGYYGHHVSGPYKDRLGWIPARKKFTVNMGTTATVHLERLAQPDDVGYLLIEVPQFRSCAKLTLEARRRVGYDLGVPAEGVLIHRVDCFGGAIVVDVDRNGDVNDEGAVLALGESFEVEEFGLTVTVEEQRGNGYQLRIARTGARVTAAMLTKD